MHAVASGWAALRALLSRLVRSRRRRPSSDYPSANGASGAAAQAPCAGQPVAPSAWHGMRYSPEGWAAVLQGLAVVLDSLAALEVSCMARVGALEVSCMVRVGSSKCAAS